MKGIMDLSAEVLRDLAKEAVEMGNHTKFAAVLLHLSCYPETIFKEKTGALFRNEVIEKLGTLSELRIMKPKAWRDENAQYDEKAKNTSEYFFWKTIYKVINGGGASRDHLVQVAIAAGLSVYETNSLLLAAGEQMLYVLDPVDAVALFYLQKFHEEGAGEGLSANKKLSLVKFHMNELLHKWDGPRAYKPESLSLRDLSEPEELVDEVQSFMEESDEEEKAFVVCLLRKMLVYPPKGAGRTFAGTLDKLLKDISKKRAVFRAKKSETVIFTGEEIERFGLQERGGQGERSKKWRVNLPGCPCNQGERSEKYLVWNPKTCTIQRFSQKGGARHVFSDPVGMDIDKEIQEAIFWLQQKVCDSGEGLQWKPSDLTKIFQDALRKAKTLEEFVDFGNKEGGGTVFAQKCYGFLRKTNQYLEHRERYVKNIVPSRKYLRLHREFPVSIDPSDRPKEDVGSKPAARKETREAQRRKRISEINMIMDMHLQKGYPVLDKEKKRGTRNTVHHMNDGRAEGDLEVYTGQTTAYNFELDSKKNLIKYAVATGHEAELAEYLQLAGYWSVDWIDWVEKGGEKPKALETLDIVDYFCLYAYACRRQYLSSWLKDAQKQTMFVEASLRREIEQGNDFPMAVLLLDIAEAFQKLKIDVPKIKLIIEEITGEPNKKGTGKVEVVWRDSEEEKKECTELEEKRKEMIKRNFFIFNPVLKASGDREER